jgi:hypothetical protein
MTVMSLDLAHAWLAIPYLPTLHTKVPSASSDLRLKLNDMAENLLDATKRHGRCWFGAGIILQQTPGCLL